MPIPSTLAAQVFRARIVAVQVAYERPRPAPPPAAFELGFQVGVFSGLLHAIAIADSQLIAGSTITSLTPSIAYDAGVADAGGFIRFDVTGGPLPVGDELIRFVVPCNGADWPRAAVALVALPPDQESAS